MVLKKLFGSAVIAGLLLGGAAAAEAKDALTLQLKWVTQAQFAGYYVAKDKGFFDEVGLDVTIKAGGPDINPSQVIAGGGADVVVDWMPSALATREKGVPLVNIAQFFQKSGMMLTCRKDAGIKSPKDFKDQTLGVWFGGNEYPFLNWMNKLGYKTDGSAGGVKVLKQGFNVDPLLQKQAACISTMTYNEYWQVIDGGLKAKQLVTFQYEKEGVATLEDGLYTLDKSLSDPAMVDKLARFVKAAQKGWDWAVKNPKDSVKIVLANDATGAQTEKHQLRMMKEIAKLVGKNPKGTGWLDDAAAERTVETLMSGGSDPVITKKPEGAWTHDIIEKANAM
ncbi:ABC transporter substrate-binding protein [Dongia rigui]|uniref:Thiamine pyrimidine synthase n=1 Tax=Dongia rigui TaxID=940149 RepID=A0ABU5E300_9PROT|nr:ABC transporter substrate-binding protein [Dongia rigui]MDY0873977.1 ABC transporter substrate-binding protein [Dongia rigui]